MMNVRFIVDTCMSIRIQIRRGDYDKIPGLLTYLDYALEEEVGKLSNQTRFLIQTTKEEAAKVLNAVQMEVQEA